MILLEEGDCTVVFFTNVSGGIITLIFQAGRCRARPVGSIFEQMFVDDVSLIFDLKIVLILLFTILPLPQVGIY